ncbi:efflux RND transporter periplasmic adaptor subunit [Microvirga massiliensis]|uniref:efflux RND transporter periplasmic adaptor subunit n=1 Tax=Microvirga massiliensis TaxID=1033741 RepID=UPI0006604770|nr:efflux RND transporter periplasmic adaptor subunit [Microvirga massiliensis]
MRVSSQLAVIVVLGVAGYGGWYSYQHGYLAALPIAGSYFAKPAGTAAGPGAAPANAPVVEVETVRTGRVVETKESVGTLRALESITVTSKVAGVIETIEFEEGQKVSAGDVLLRLDGLERRADIEMAVAEKARATAQRDEIATRLERAQALRRTGAGTEAQVEDLNAQVRTLDRAIAAAEARLKAAEARLEDLVIRAPFAGRVGTRGVSLGAYVSPGTRITTLDDLSRVRLDFSVPENLLGQVNPGQGVTATSVAFQDRAFRGRVSLIDPRVDPVTRSVRLTAEFENPDESLRPGMFLAVTLDVLTKENAILIPEEAVVSEGLRHIVYPVKDNKTERRVIRIGQRQSGKVEVLEGLAAGETIVVLGVQRVRPGATVQPHPLESPEPPPAARREPDAAPPAPRGAVVLQSPVTAAHAAERP